MSDESAAEVLHISKNPLKIAMGQLFELIGRFPPIGWYAAHIAPRRLALEEVAVTLPALPPGLAGLRIGFLSDIHHVPGRPVALLARAVELLNAAGPDLVLLGGDYVNSTSRDFARPLALFARLRAPLGVYGILGNHDYWAGADYLAALLAGAGVTMLRNEARRVETPGGAPCWIVGVDSTVRRHDDLEEALAGVPGDEFRLLLAHEPEVADTIIGRNLRVDLQLSGHSHGGQVVLPGIGAPLLPTLGRRYLRGLSASPTHPVYTSRGLGTVSPFLRFNCPPEVTVLTLRAAGDDGAAGV